MPLNEDLARWLGYRHLDKPEIINDVSLAAGWWISPDRSSCEADLPDWEHSRDLIARDLLPKLAEIPGAKVALAYALRDRVEHRIGTWEFVWYCVTLPPADLAAAIWEVVKDA